MGWRWIAAGAAGAVGLALVATQQVKEPPRSYEEAVAQVLDDRAVAYSKVQMGAVYIAADPWPGYVSGLEASYLIEVQVDAAASERGWVICQQDTQRCTLTLPDLGLRSVALPSLAQDPPWVLMARRTWREVRERLPP